MRPGEILALRWGKVDSQIIEIAQRVYRGLPDDSSRVALVANSIHVQQTDDRLQHSSNADFGSGLNEQQVLKDLREQGLVFQSIDLEGVQVRLFGPVVILTGESRAISTRGSTTSRSQFRLAAVYSQEQAGVQLVHFQSTGPPD